MDVVNSLTNITKAAGLCIIYFDAVLTTFELPFYRVCCEEFILRWIFHTKADIV